MKRLLRLALPISLITAMLLALGYWNLRPDRMFEDDVASSELEPEIDYYVENATTRQYMPDGSLNYQLQAPVMKHFRSTGASQLSNPYLLMYRGGEHPWQIQSDQAVVNRSGSKVTMRNNVRVARKDASGRETRLTTEYLLVYPDREYAETPSKVRIEAANGVTNAKGLQAYLKEGRMLLKSQVRGQHEIR